MRSPSTASLAFVQKLAGARADEVLARYPWPDTSDRYTAAYLVGGIMTDSGSVAGIGGCGLRSMVWPGYHSGKGLMLSLRAGGRSALIDNDRYSTEHQCAFWDTMPGTQHS
ncbi:hypothetical protein [Streptomyces sp. NEAU-174]|uniref:hypothetical protein n=1 Tax=Streptomyces sp. NEAU-174 TaxID=3458254 RepID=UPI004043ECA2